MSNALTKEYFFCYSVPLFKFLKMDKGISFICYALHDKTHKPFWMFEKNDELKTALHEYQYR
ncbi:hypothetical protein J2Z22_004789 [Paenibacillus forsythiae]|uniref:Uncharacterized protein n=1 Tax=Paenibacillus forsythiae TaxID=365616 RepID=A0ABU3HEF9_9BACL|nr:hypothetical protein [Paenibacillus forsythiae]